VVALDLPYTALEGRSVRLEPYGGSHLQGLSVALGRPEVFAGGWGGGRAASCAGDAFADWLLTYLPLGSAHVYVVMDAHRAVIGTTTILDLNPDAETAHIGYTAYSPEVWGTTVNPACKLLLLTHLFDHGFGRVKLQADVLNARSRGGIEKLGAQFEGIARRDAQRADGSWRDAAVYSIIADDWPKVQAGLEARCDGYGRYAHTMDDGVLDELVSLRRSIDNIDAALIHLLAERFKSTQAVGRLKAATQMPPSDPERERVQIERLRALATDAQLDPAFAEKWFNFIVAEVIHHHEQIATTGTIATDIA
jgi:monofunctional chorismate mutase